MSRDVRPAAAATDPQSFARSHPDDRFTLEWGSHPARIIVRGEAAPSALLAIGWALPLAPTTAATRGPLSALWLGPDEWLLLDETDQTAASTPQALSMALAGVTSSVVDISHRQLAITIAGPAAVDALAMFVPIDLDVCAFPVDCVTRTVFEKTEIVLWRRSVDTFHIEVWRSFAPYIEALLMRAQSELRATQRP